MSEVKISIIMPVYNAEKYLRDTLESVKNQSFKDFELVVVNDGSSDSSVQIISEYYDDINIRLINQKNSGVSTARNVGIEKSSGKYIAFLDADDIMHPEFLNIMYKSILKQNSDMVFCEYIPFYGRCGFKSIDVLNLKYEALQSDQNKSVFDYMMEIGLDAALWNKLIKKSIITKYNIQFNPQSSFGEDMFFNWKCVLASVNVVWVKECLYGYRQSVEGATFKYHPNLFLNYCNEYDSLSLFIEKNSIEIANIEKSIHLNLVKRIPALLRMIVRNKVSWIKKYNEIKTLINDKRISDALSTWCTVCRDKEANNGLIQAIIKNKYLKVFVLSYYIEYRFIIARKIKNKLTK